MKTIHGIAASAGLAIGPAYLLHNQRKIVKRHVEELAPELQRFESAKKKASAALNEIYLKSLKLVGEKDSMIFQIHIMMLQDEDFTDAVIARIREEQENAEYAVWETGNEFSQRFAEMDDEYMRARKTDVLDISQRLIRCLDEDAGIRAEEHPASPYVLAAEDLTPSETIQLDKSLVLAIVTKEGSASSHSAILSRTIGIPSVAGLGTGFDALEDGMNVVVNGTDGDVFLEPDEETTTRYRQKQQEYLRRKKDLEQSAGGEAITVNGKKIEVCANIGHPEDAESALKNGADGIGLFRSEFLYMGRDSLPTEEEQVLAYKSVVERMAGRRVIIRTLDIGADKQVPYLNLPKEENPALGYRAIRICLDREELFRTQLRALLRASAFGRLAIMFPMITSEKELRRAKEILNEEKAALTAQKTAFDANVETGVMIETPAAVMLSEELAKEADFFSIGTNDLTQYTLAADRMNPNIAGLYDQRHPAVLKMIRMTVKSAKEAGIWVGVCGESAADPRLTKFYLDIGVDELSVAPPSVPELKNSVRNIRL